MGAVNGSATFPLRRVTWLSKSLIWLRRDSTICECGSSPWCSLGLSLSGVATGGVCATSGAEDSSGILCDRERDRTLKKRARAFLSFLNIYSYSRVWIMRATAWVRI